MLAIMVASQLTITTVDNQDSLGPRGSGQKRNVWVGAGGKFDALDFCDSTETRNVHTVQITLDTIQIHLLMDDCSRIEV